MKNMKENSPLKDLCPEKNLTNHSARKTVVKKLKSPGIPKCEIKNITETITTQETNESNWSFQELSTAMVLFMQDVF